MIRYAIVRKDMSVSQKLVQLAHVCLTETPHSIEDKVHLCLLVVDNAIELHQLRLKVGVGNCKVFFDPDYHEGPTALITKVYSNDDEARALFREYELLK